MFISQEIFFISSLHKKFKKGQRIEVERELMRQMKGHFYDSRKLISVKKSFCRGRKLPGAAN